MPIEKPQQFLPKPSGNDSVDSVQESLAQVTQTVRNQGLKKQVVEKLAPSEPPGRGIQLRPNQTVDIPNTTGKNISSVSVASLINPRNNAASAPIAAPNLQMIELPGELGKRIVRVRYIPPKKDDGTDIDVPSVRAKLELG
jgi:hypothetical protein